MAYTTSTLLLALMLVATASVVHCTVFYEGLPVAKVTVDGSVTCTTTGEGAPDVPVALTFDGGKTISGSTQTDECGGFVGLAAALTGGIGINILNGKIVANVPKGTCNATAPAVVVTATAVITGTTVTPEGIDIEFTVNVGI